MADRKLGGCFDSGIHGISLHCGKRSSGDSPLEYAPGRARYRPPSRAPESGAVTPRVPGPQFTHTSWDDHRILLDVLEGRAVRGRSGRVVPYGVFTDPQVAGVGLNEREARARGVRHEVAKLPFGQVARAIELDETAGTMKVLIDPETERILGASCAPRSRRASPWSSRGPRRWPRPPPLPRPRSRRPEPGTRGAMCSESPYARWRYMPGGTKSVEGSRVEPEALELVAELGSRSFFSSPSPRSSEA
ncbi:MAG TPA: hypothetical protein VF904_07720 [Anaeromyxobacteraceae bacterium]